MYNQLRTHASYQTCAYSVKRSLDKLSAPGMDALSTLHPDCMIMDIVNTWQLS